MGREAGFSTAAAKAPPPVEMTIFFAGFGENRQQQQQITTG